MVDTRESVVVLPGDMLIYRHRDVEAANCIGLRGFAQQQLDLYCLRRPFSQLNLRVRGDVVD